jgi:hypothetical protein
MPQVDIDGANSKVSADTIRGQSGTTITVLAGHNLVGSGSGLTALPAANITGTLPAISGANLTNLPGGGFEVGARAYSAVAQTIAASTRTVVQLEAESYDLNNDFNTTTDRYVVPTTGEYLICGGVKLGSPTDGTKVQTEIQVNGSLTSYTIAHASQTDHLNSHLSEILQLSASDYVQLSIYQDSGSTKDTEPGVTNVFLAILRLS